GAPRDRDQRQAGRQLGGDVLEAVDRQIDLAGQQLLLDLLDPDPLAAEVDHRPGLLPVPLGDDDLLLDGQAGVDAAELGPDVVGLPAGQRAAARADDDLRSAHWLAALSLTFNVSPAGGSAVAGSFSWGTVSTIVRSNRRCTAVTSGTPSPEVSFFSAICGAWSSFLATFSAKSRIARLSRSARWPIPDTSF